MKSTNIAMLVITVMSFFLVDACKWKPGVTPVAVTAPWAQLHLPVEDGAVVWESTGAEFKAVHKSSDKAGVADKYKTALEGQGWKMTKYEPGDITYLYFESPDGNTYELQSYDFEKTGIIIKRQ